MIKKPDLSGVDPTTFRPTQEPPALPNDDALLARQPPHSAVFHPCGRRAPKDGRCQQSLLALTESLNDPLPVGNMLRPALPRWTESLNLLRAALPRRTESLNNTEPEVGRRGGCRRARLTLTCFRTQTHQPKEPCGCSVSAVSPPPALVSGMPASSFHCQSSPWLYGPSFLREL